MDGKSSYKYHLPHRVVLSAVFVGLWLTGFWAFGSFTLTAFLAVALTIAGVLAFIWIHSVITIDRVGVTLYRVNKLIWSDISSTKCVNFLGLPYLRISRKKGIPFWLPLYFEGPKPIDEVLLAYTPAAIDLKQS
jgi:hypothetical protein